MLKRFTIVAALLLGWKGHFGAEAQSAEIKPNFRPIKMSPRIAVLEQRLESGDRRVLPWVQDHWNVTRDPQKSIVRGLSMGGSAAAFIALRRPDLFGNVLSQSGAFADGNGDVRWEWLASQYKASPKLSLRFFIEQGLLEDVSRDGPTGLAANRRFVDVLKSKGYAVMYQEVGGSHEPVHWRGALGDGLIVLVK